jgi:hypothetical protein
VELEPKGYTLTVQRTDFLVEKRDVTASEQGDEEVVVDLTRGEGIGIEVKDGIYGMPLKGVYARALAAEKKPAFAGSIALDSEGRGEIPSLKPGVYSLTLYAPGYAPLSVPQVSVPARSLAVAMTPGGTLEIQAGPKTLATGSARIRVLPPAGAPFSWAGEDGTVAISVPVRRFENVAPGVYGIQPANGEAKSVTVQEGQTTVVTLP